MDRVLLHPDERMDDLLTNDLKIIQSAEVFSFSMDAVLLAHFCSVPVRGRIVDLCSGNGVIPMLLATRTKAPIVGVEIQERLADMARRSVALNSLGEQIDIVHGDLRQAHETLGYGRFDLVTVNPPYLRVAAGEQNVNEHVASARHEMHGTLEEIAAACAKLVRTGGKVAMVHRPSRLADILEALRNVKLEPKRVRFVHPREGTEANMVLVEAIRDAKPDIRLLSPLIVYKSGNEYCDELLHIYYGDRAPAPDESEELR